MVLEATYVLPITLPLVWLNWIRYRDPNYTEANDLPRLLCQWVSKLYNYLPFKSLKTWGFLWPRSHKKGRSSCLYHCDVWYCKEFSDQALVLTSKILFPHSFELRAASWSELKDLFLEQHGHRSGSNIVLKLIYKVSLERDIWFNT